MTADFTHKSRFKGLWYAMHGQAPAPSPQPLLVALRDLLFTVTTIYRPFPCLLIYFPLHPTVFPPSPLKLVIIFLGDVLLSLGGLFEGAVGSCGDWVGVVLLLEVKSLCKISQTDVHLLCYWSCMIYLVKMQCRQSQNYAETQFQISTWGCPCHWVECV